MEELVGRTIKGVTFDFNTQTLLTFDTDEGELTYITTGDCCSHSYITDINGAEALVGSFVTSVAYKEVDKDSPYMRTSPLDTDCISYYGYTIKTTKGYVDLVFHNDSNGYYGGEIGLLQENKYTKDMMAKANMQPLVKDFSN